jgi:hypothetical protein
MSVTRDICLGLLASLVFAMAPDIASAQQQKPNILVIMGDDIGYWNISAYNRGMMGYRTPNIDRIANEGAIFTDYYGQQSCTAGRAAFITGQSPMRTGLNAWRRWIKNSSPPHSTSWIKPTGTEAVLCVVQLDPDAHLDEARARGPRQDRARHLS